MFQRRKRNLDLTGTKGQSMREASSHGISWDTVQQRTVESESPYNEDVEIESGWEEGEEGPLEENFKQRPPIGQSGLAFSERQSSKIADSRQHDTFSPALKRKPNFYEQNKKLTIYMEKELLETIARLKKGRYIPSYSWLVNVAVREYLSQK